MNLNLSNLTEENLLACDTIAVGAARSLCEAYGRDVQDFIAKHPELWRHEIPAQPFRDYLATGV